MRPAYAFALMVMFVLPTSAQSAPVLETKAVTVPPRRASFSQIGAAWDAPDRYVVAAPALLRVMNSTSPVGRTSRITCAALADSASRHINPAFAYGLVFSTLVTRATSVASSAIGCDTKWNASMVPQMSEPPPTTVKPPFAYE